MNIFVLSTGRSGTTSFIEACKCINNYSAGHETLSYLTGRARLKYPRNHIEADNRLVWLLGRLDECYGDNAFYVHLLRKKNQVVNSYIKRQNFGIIKAYREGILMGAEGADEKELCSDYYDTANSNIELFLKDKTQKRKIWIENIINDFKNFWMAINAKGNYLHAISKLANEYN